MYFYGFLHSIQLFFIQGADKFYHPAFVEGSNLIGLDFGIFGQINRGTAPLLISFLILQSTSLSGIEQIEDDF